MLGLRFAIGFLILSFLCVLNAPMSFAGTQSVVTQKKSIVGNRIQSTARHRVRSMHSYLVNGKRLFLVPPPPPYVPSLLPELSYNRYYGYSLYGKSGSGPRLFKPNKYVTYCL